MPNPFLIATRKGSARLHNTLCGLRQQFCFICTVLWRFWFFFLNDIRELRAPKEWFKAKSESETAPEERQWPFGSSSLEKLSQRLAEKAHLLTKTRKRQERTFWKTRSSLLGTDDCPNQPSICRVTEIPISALEDKWCLSWSKERTVRAQALGSPSSPGEICFPEHLLTGWPLPTALEPNPSPFIRGAIGSQLSGDGPTPQS